MSCPTMKSIRPFVILLPLIALQPSQCSQEQIDSFCVLYIKMLDDDKDAAAAIKLPSGMKRRLLANEQLYKTECSQPKT